jgi:hypothetical protein
MEDLINPQNNFPEKIKEWQIKYPNCTFELVYLPKKINQGYNNVLVVYKR